MDNKEALGWTLGDIRDISPTILQHRIYLETMPSLTVIDKEG